MRMSGYPSKTESLSFSRTGKWLASSGADSIVLWPFFGGGPMGKAPLELAGGDGVLCTRVAFQPQQELLAAGFSRRAGGDRRRGERAHPAGGAAGPWAGDRAGLVGGRQPAGVRNRDRVRRAVRPLATLKGMQDGAHHRAGHAHAQTRPGHLPDEGGGVRGGGAAARWRSATGISTRPRCTATRRRWARRSPTSGVARGDIHLTTKVWWENLGRRRDAARRSRQPGQAADRLRRPLSDPLAGAGHGPAGRDAAT